MNLNPGSRERFRTPAALLLVASGLVLCASAGSAFWALFGLTGALAAALWFSTREIPPHDETPPFTAPFPDARLEWILAGLILLLAAFLRFWRLETVPPGIFLDMGYDGLGGLRILKDGWRPGPFLGGPNPESTLLLYALAAWFAFIPATVFSYATFFVFASLAGLVCFYGVFRIMAGPRAALLSVFLLAVSRWHITFSRNDFPNMFSLLFVAACLLCLLEGLRTGRRALFLLWGLLMGAGLWTYQAFKVVPLWMAVILFYEFHRNRAAVSRNLGALGWSLVLAILTAAPVLSAWFQRGSMGRREAHLSILNKLGEPGFVPWLWKHLSSYLLFFHRGGGTSPQHNLPGAPLLDVLTGFFLILGLAALILRFRSRKSFYALGGILFLGLPGFLSADAANANRILAVAPWLCLAAAMGLDVFRGVFFDSEPLLPRGEKDGMRVATPGIRRTKYSVLLVWILTALTWMNVDFYFRRWANDPRVWADFSVAETKAGQTVASEPPGTHHRVASGFLNHFTFRFLAYDRLTKCEALDPSRFLLPPPTDVERVLFTLDSNRTGLLARLKKGLPGGEERMINDPWGLRLLTTYSVPASVWRGFQDDGAGLRARFYVRTGSGDLLFLSRTDKLVEYNNGNDFPRPDKAEGPVWGKWTGFLDIRKPGEYQLEVDSFQGAAVFLDGRLNRAPMGKWTLQFRSGKARRKIEIRCPTPPAWLNHLTVSCRRKDDSGGNQDEVRFLPEK